MTITTVVEFKHPLLMSLLMSSGKMILLFYFKLRLAGNNEASINNDQPKINPIIMMLPAIFDAFGSIMNIYGLIKLTESIWPMMGMF